MGKVTADSILTGVVASSVSFHVSDVGVAWDGSLCIASGTDSRDAVNRGRRADAIDICSVNVGYAANTESYGEAKMGASGAGFPQPLGIAIAADGSICRETRAQQNAGAGKRISPGFARAAGDELIVASWDADEGSAGQAAHRVAADRGLPSTGLNAAVIAQ